MIPQIRFAIPMSLTGRNQDTDKITSFPMLMNYKVNTGERGWCLLKKNMIPNRKKRAKNRCAKI